MPGQPVVAGERGVLVASLSLAAHSEPQTQEELGALGEDPLLAKRIEYEREEETWVAACSDMAEIEDL